MENWSIYMGDEVIEGRIFVPLPWKKNDRIFVHVPSETMAMN